MIIVQYVSPRLYEECKNGVSQFLVQFAGVSDKSKKIMRLQVWDMPFGDKEEAKKTMADYLEKVKGGSFLIVLGGLKKND